MTTPTSDSPGGESFDEDAFSRAMGEVNWEQELTIDDLFGETAGVSIGVVLTSVASFRIVAAALRLLTKDGGANESYHMPEGAYVIPTESGAVIAAHTHAQGADAMGALASTALKGVPVVVLHHTAGHMKARRWRNGKVEEEISSGLVLATCEDIVEDVILGDVAPKDADGAIEIASISKGSALKMLLMGKRSLPKNQKDNTDD